MRGKGSPFFAVWGYVLSHMTPIRGPNKTIIKMTVELNPEIIGFLIGEKQQVVSSKLEEMCQPDPKSRTPDHEGKKLLKIGEYTYEVVNGLYYRSIRNEDDRREYQRVKQAEYRSKKKPRKSAATVRAENEEREKRYVSAHENGDQEAADRIAAEGLNP